MNGCVKLAASAALAAILAAPPALAREDFCLNANGSLNKIATKGYRKIEKNRNEQLMRRIHGQWFSQSQNPFTGQRSYLWQTYEGRGVRSGLFSYFNRVCDANNQFCSEFEGVGLWAVQGRTNNFSGMRIVSDLQLDHFCQLIDGRLSNGGDVWTTKDGQFRQQRVRNDAPKTPSDAEAERQLR